MAGAMRTWVTLTGLLALAGAPASAEPQAVEATSRRPRVPAGMESPFKRVPRPIIGAPSRPPHELPQSDSFELVGHHPLPNPGDTVARGRNGPTAISDDCLYVASGLGRRTGTGAATGTAPLRPEVLIVDISNPRRPKPVGALPTALHATARELRTIPDAHTLIVMSTRVSGPDSGAVNHYQIHDITDCRHPVLRQTISFGGDRPQTLFVWRDPREPARFLLYASVQPDDASEPSLRVFEWMAPPDGPVTSEPVATFTPATAQRMTAFAWPDVVGAMPFTRDGARAEPVPPFAWPGAKDETLQSVSVSPDGTRVYATDRHGGYHVLDSSRLANREPCTRDSVAGDGAPRLCLRGLGSLSDVRGDDATARLALSPVPGRPYLVSSGERCGANDCAWSAGRLLDLSDERHPQPVSRYLVPRGPESRAVQGASPPPLVFSNLFVEASGPAGLRVWDIANPLLPMEVGVYVPRPVARVVERSRGESPGVGMASSPLLYNGLLYVTDEDNGLYVLRYKGPRAGELPRTGLYVSGANYLAPPARPSQTLAARGVGP
ncbi:hypothetical protein JY651_43705 [Pyxidicoccus parkwayensis]|uniref:Lipoprotein n=1 Tax=Pyxidicoccus parkwayensis TaxID=2813578 RepID=A0ABX7NT70_9BACT|nr:hypothetical protein [Pyxidicoccus parkwaysis]QSQ21980.1 hypothetical protein JY651_43705 [Pyxidicoccus parkwaysis]